jgi:hypothetical protein
MMKEGYAVFMKSPGLLKINESGHLIRNFGNNPAAFGW